MCRRRRIQRTRPARPSHGRWPRAASVSLLAAALATALATALLLPGPTGSLPRAAAAVRARGAGVPCTERAPRAPRLHARATTLGVPAPPFGVAIAPGGRFAFAGLGGSVGVFSLATGRLHLRSTIAVPGQARGLALSPNGRYLVVADGAGGAAVLDVASAERGSGSALLGQLTSTGHGAIEASVSPDGAFVFVTLEYGNELVVFNLRRAIATGFASSQPVGVVPLENPVGMATSPDGRYLYVTSEVGTSPGQGTLTVVDIATAETNASRAVVASVPAGCDPVRVVAARGSVYVAARGSDSVLWFSSRALVHAPSHALKARVRVGPEPVGLAVVDGGAALLVADSDRYGTSAHASLALVRLHAGGRPTLAGYLVSGRFPRDIATARRGHLAIVADYRSSRLETLSLRSLPAARSYGSVRTSTAVTVLPKPETRPATEHQDPLPGIVYLISAVHRSPA